MTNAIRITAPVLGAPIDSISWSDAIERISAWAQARESRYVCICNAHSVVTAAQDPAFAAVLRGADMATPDGAPVAWMLRRLGHANQQRINGPDLMLRYCQRAADAGISVFLLGSTERTLATLDAALRSQFPRLRIAGTLSPPFRALTATEDLELTRIINASGAGVVFVSLGCPKQETWMAAHRGAVKGVMIGVGAAFDFHAGTVTRAPEWMRRSGLEWLHRLVSEPRRLWRRYLITNPAFIVGAIRQLSRRRHPQ
jgi:N-acetylglucosaminyldiphosphoundecaprenol N-acetyl-beta-D-mannosaminyltransferase